MAKPQALSFSLPVHSRRSFLVVATGFSASFGFISMSSAVTDPSRPGGVTLPHSAHAFEPTQWFSIDGEGFVAINITRAEMGQHVGTALARILADELEVSWDKVRINHVDTDPKWGLMVTGGSWSVWQSFPIYSRAGAAGRIALIEAGAQLLGVQPSECNARDGVISAAGKTISYAQIVQMGKLERHYTAEEMAKLDIKPASERRLIGRNVVALDVPRKTDGSARYGIDATIKGMVYARPRLPPTRNGSVVQSVDDTQARSVKGYLQSLVLNDPSNTVPGWVMVIAETYPAAIRAADLVKIVWKAGATADVSEKDIQDHAAKLIGTPTGGALLDTGGGDVDAALRRSASRIQETYTTSSVLHFQLEPVNALAFEKDGVFEVHTGNQWQSLIMPTLAKALGRPETSIVMRTYLIGGGFGRRLNGDYAVPAALASKALGKPVKMILTRADDALFDSVRSPSVQKLTMAFDEHARVIAMEHDACAGWPTEVMAPALLPKGANGAPYDPFAISGADHWYDVGAQKVRAISNDLANATFRPGWLRSVGPGWTNWALESFMDEAAHQTKQDAVAFRLKLLSGAGRNVGSSPDATGGALRQARVVREAARLAGWGSALPEGTALGLATSFGQERTMPTWVACVARVRVDRRNGDVVVEKLTVVTDAGTIIDPDSAFAQTEGSVLWGLSMALFEGTVFEKGQVRDTNLDSYMPLRMSDTPELSIHFIDSTEAPVGLGEPATTVVAPAIGNAIFNAVGARVRHLPITAQAVKLAMKV